MAIIERSAREMYPGALTVVEEPVSECCAGKPSVQELATLLQAGAAPFFPSATIVAGKIYTNLPAGDVETLCAP